MFLPKLFQAYQSTEDVSAGMPRKSPDHQYVEISNDTSKSEGNQQSNSSLYEIVQ